MRSAEHPLLAFLLSRIRALLTISSLLAYAGSMALVMQHSRAIIEWSWIGFASAGILVALIICASYSGPKWMRLRARIHVVMSLLCIWLASLIVLIWGEDTHPNRFALISVLCLCMSSIVLMRSATLLQLALKPAQARGQIAESEEEIGEMAR